MKAAAPRSRTRRVVRAVLVRVLVYSAVLYLTVLAIFFFLQASLIFVGNSRQGSEEARIDAVEEGVELVHLTTTGGDRIVALFGAALAPDGRPLEDAASRPTLLCFYGNGDCVKYAWELADQFRRLGANVMLTEYPGYGMSTGSPGESACYEAADAAYDHAVSRPGADPKRIVGVGWSMGGAVALELATRRPLARLVVVNTFTNLGDMVRLSYPYLLVWPILQHRFDNLAKIDRVPCPIVIGHATNDTLIPYAMSERLAAAARSPVEHVRVEGGGHNYVFPADGGKMLLALKRVVDEVGA